MNDHSHTHNKPSIGGPVTDSPLGRFWQWLIELLEGVQQPKHPHPLQHLVPGQLVYCVEHDEELTDDQISNIITWSQTQWLEESQQQITILLRRSLPFTGFTLIFTDVLNIDNVVDLIVFLNEKLITSSPFPALTIEISPNWLIGSASHGAHPPSPGSWPVEGNSPSDTDWSFWLKDKQTTSSLPFAAEQGSDIHVAILDTAPADFNLNEAYDDKWGSGHRLLERLWGSNGRLHLHTNIYADIKLMDHSVVGHRYLMPDHGLFIAGIVNSIAPEATLHLFKAFTPYGSASTETIAQSVDQLLKALRNPNDITLNPERIKRPLIVNCCFSFHEHGAPNFPVELEGKIRALRKMFKELADEDEVIVVAAVGNNANRIDPPRYPAAFEKVIPVGALPKGFPLSNSKYQAASYSNLANKPSEIGYMTLGGEPGAKQGVLGIFTSEIPVYAPSEGCLSFLWRIFTGKHLNGWKGEGHLPPNPEELTIDQIRYEVNNTGYVWWAGTSCAAPIISGVIANWCSQPAPSRAPDDPLRRSINLENVKWALRERSQTVTTDKNEQVIRVDQGNLPL